ncbi:MAG: DUF47 family protein [Thaumarchaeota archaeon]|nr:DUF47 family protein [Candidatus Geocrenenecus arthurdayi]MCL7389676.1 DUF47 family protein [Candidatus Geocrenenecus arthurdayi]MCL7402244.1 DUF47 family protein [Candidatus Geocrenenecus arthurdayi]
MFYRRERKVVDSIEEYIRKIVETVKYLMDISNSIKKGRLGDIVKIYNNIDTLETEADSMRRVISEELCKGTYFAHIREDLLNLVEEIDNIADYTKDSVKQLVITTPSWDLLYFTFSIPEMDKYIQSCIKASEKLLESFRIFKENMEKAKPILQEIEDIEEEADELKTLIIKSIFREADRFKVLDVIQVKEMIDIMDNICDSAEDASDVLFQIIAQRYG